MDLTAPALVKCDQGRLVPAVSAPDYLECLIDVILEEQIQMVFSLNDLELEMLSRSRDLIEARTGATVYVGPPASTAIGADKWLTFEFATRHNIPTPATYLDVESARAAIATGECASPLIVKPRWGSASIGLVRVEAVDELDAAYNACREAVAGSALAALGTDRAVVIQERVSGSEYGVDLLYGRNEEFIGFTAKRKLAMRAGETDKAVTVDPDLFQSSVNRIAKNLPHRGNLDCDFLERDGELLLLEINPRFGGGYPFTHLAGANHVSILLADYSGRPLPSYGYDIGRTFAKYDQLTETPTRLAESAPRLRHKVHEG